MLYKQEGYVTWLYNLFTNLKIFDWRKWIESPQIIHSILKGTVDFSLYKVVNCDWEYSNRRKADINTV